MIIKYPAIFIDDIGCDKASVYYDNSRFYLEVRGHTFYCEGTEFDFYTNELSETVKKFCLKGNELINYVLDIQIPLELKNDEFNKIEKFILRIERQKNYYNNSLLFQQKESIHEVKGYDFKQLIIKMKKELSSKYNLNLHMPLAVGM